MKSADFRNGLTGPVPLQRQRSNGIRVVREVVVMGEVSVDAIYRPERDPELAALLKANDLTLPEEVDDEEKALPL